MFASTILNYVMLYFLYRLLLIDFETIRLHFFLTWNSLRIKSDNAWSWLAKKLLSRPDWSENYGNLPISASSVLKWRHAPTRPSFKELFIQNLFIYLLFSYPSTSGTLFYIHVRIFPIVSQLLNAQLIINFTSFCVPQIIIFIYLSWCWLLPTYRETFY